MAGQRVPELGPLLRLQIDSQSKAGRLWRRERDASLSTRFADIFEDGFEEEADVNYSETEIIGRAENHQTWINNGNRNISITFKFHVEGDEAPDVQEAIIAGVVEPARWLEALKYPLVDQSGSVIAPPRATLQMGQLYTGRVIATSVTPAWKGPWDQDSLLPHHAEVSATFTEVNKEVGSFNVRGPRRLSQKHRRKVGGTNTGRALNSFSQIIRRPIR